MSKTERTLADVVCRDVLFAHWPIATAKLRSVVPDALSIDTFDGSAWLGILVVDVPEARVRGVPFRGSFTSINLRTYVSFDGDPGVYFISLETEEKISAWLARNGFGLPYHHATITSEYDDGALSIESHREAGSHPAGRFAATYRPTVDTEPVEADPGSHEAFVIERSNYFFTAGPTLRRTVSLFGSGGIGTDASSGSGSAASAAASDAAMIVGSVAHDPWPLQPVEAEVTDNTLFAAAGVPDPDASPTFHYARQQHMAAERFREVSLPAGSRTNTTP